MWYIIATSFTVFLIKSGNGGEIITHPKTFEAKIGDLAYFNCSTSKTSGEIQWFHYPNPNSERKLVYGFDQFHSVYTGFRMEMVESTRSWNLVIPSVAIENSGKYECQDDIGRGERSSANLIVLSFAEFKSHIEAKNVIGENNCGIEPNQLILTCNVQYYGSETPTFEWKKIGDNGSISDGVTHTTLQNNSVIYNLTFKGSAVENGSSYACYSARSKTSRAICKSDSIMVVGKVVEVSECKECKCPSCQSCRDTTICPIFFILILLFSALISLGVWYQIVCGQKETFCHLKWEKNDAKTFVSLMAIPFNIGLLLWYLVVFRRMQPRKEEANQLSPADSYEQSPANVAYQSLCRKGSEEIIASEAKPIQETELEEKQTEAIARLQKEIEQKENRIEKVERFIQKLQEQLNGNRESYDIIVKQHEEKVEEFHKEIELRGNKIKEMEKLIQELQDENRQLKENSARQEEKVKELELHLYPSEIDDYVKKPVLVHTIKPIPVDDTNASKFINGLAMLDNELFVLQENSSEIVVYDSVTYQFQRKLHVPIIKSVFDMTTANADKCLFIIGLEHKAEPGMESESSISSEERGIAIGEEADGMQPKIEGVKDKILNKEARRPSIKPTFRSKKQTDIVKKELSESLIGRIDTQGELRKPWPKSSGGYMGRLSTCESNLIVCLLERNTISEFSRDGVLLHTVRLSPAAGCKNPLHAIKVTNKYFVVTHGYEKDELHRICLVDLNGNVIKECKKEKLNGPLHVIEGCKRSLLVADTGNCRILLLNSTIEYQRKLIELEDKQLPVRMIFDESQRRLFVALNKKSESKGFKDGLVLIFNIK